MAYAGALFADACLRGLNGDPDVIECTYVASNITEVPFFSSKVKLGKNGEQPPASQLVCCLLVEGLLVEGLCRACWGGCAEPAGFVLCPTAWQGATPA